MYLKTLKSIEMILTSILFQVWTNADVYGEISRIVSPGPEAFYSLRWLYLCNVLAVTSDMDRQMEALVNRARKSSKGFEVKFHGPALAMFQVLLLH